MTHLIISFNIKLDLLASQSADPFPSRQLHGALQGGGVSYLINMVTGGEGCCLDA